LPLHFGHIRRSNLQGCRKILERMYQPLREFAQVIYQLLEAVYLDL
jgi:hypothetical protein